MLLIKEIQQLICCEECKHKAIKSQDYIFMCKYCKISTKDLYDVEKFCKTTAKKLHSMEFWQNVAVDINEKDATDHTADYMLKIIRENGGKIEFIKDILIFYIKNWPTGFGMDLTEITCHKLISEYKFVGI